MSRIAPSLKEQVGELEKYCLGAGHSSKSQPLYHSGELSYVGTAIYIVCSPPTLSSFLPLVVLVLIVRGASPCLN